MKVWRLWSGTMITQSYLYLDSTEVSGKTNHALMLDRFPDSLAITVLFLENNSAFSMKSRNHWYANSNVLTFPLMYNEPAHMIMKTCQPNCNLVSYVTSVFLFSLILGPCKIRMLVLYYDDSLDRLGPIRIMHFIVLTLFQDYWKLW